MFFLLREEKRHSFNSINEKRDKYEIEKKKDNVRIPYGSFMMNERHEENEINKLIKINVKDRREEIN
jgi:hypothetical protein